MTMHQETTSRPLLPMEPPKRSRLSISMKGVNGWYSANQRTPTGIGSVGTNPLPKKGSKAAGLGV